MVLPLVLLLGATPQLDVGAALKLLEKPAGLPETKEQLVLERGFASWREGSVSSELALFAAGKGAVVAVLAQLDAPKGGPSSARLRAWRLRGTEVSEAPEVLAKLPGLGAFVAPDDVALVPNLTDEDVTPWVTRVVKLRGAEVEVHWLAAALERECAKGREAQAPELLCRNVAALKYASRRVKWQPACACFKPLKVRSP